MASAKGTLTIKKGETLASAAKRIGTTVAQLSKANGGVISVKPGDKLTPPNFGRAGTANAPVGTLGGGMGTTSAVTQLPANTLTGVPTPKLNKAVTQLPANSLGGDTKNPSLTYTGTNTNEPLQRPDSTPANTPTSVGPQATNLPGQAASSYSGSYGVQGLVDAFDAALTIGDQSMMPGYISYDQATAYVLAGGGSRSDIDATMAALGYEKSSYGGYTFKGWSWTNTSGGGSGGTGTARVSSSSYSSTGTNNNPTQASMSWRVASG